MNWWAQPLLYPKNSGASSVRETVPYVRALVDYYAVLEGEPIARVAEIRLPMLIARAGRDMPMANEPLDRFLDAAFAHGVELELLNHANGEHGFDLLNDDARTRQIIRRTLRFCATSPLRVTRGTTFPLSRPNLQTEVL